MAAMATQGLEVLYSHQQIAERVAEMGAQITRDLNGEKLVMIGVLKGAAFFLVDLSRAIQALKLSVAVRRMERPFWQARYYDFNVHTHGKHVENLRYMHRNPVVRGLVARPEDWLWSSYRHYATGFKGTVEIESDWTAARRGWELPEGFKTRAPDA